MRLFYSVLAFSFFLLCGMSVWFSLSFGFLFIGNENLFFLATDALVAQRESTV